jgi:hypothetical protein
MRCDGVTSELSRRIVDLNIKHYRDLLNTELDRTKRPAVIQSLVDEEAKLAALNRRR